VESEHLRELLRQELASAREETDRLFQMLAPEAMYERPIPERHRTVFYLGHLEAFDWNMICATSFDQPSFNSHFDRLFNFGIDPIDGRLPQDKPSDWPSVQEVISYRDHVRSTVDDLLDRANLTNGSQPFVENGQIFSVAIEHRLMHAETLAYMFHWLDSEMKRPDLARGIRTTNGNVPETKRAIKPVRIPAGYAELGQQPCLFGWDNEFAAHSVFVPEFFMDTLNVTNGDFLEFVLSGAYRQRSLWSDSNWEWIQQADVQHPKFWISRGEKWFYRTMFEEVPLPRAWPVYVSHAEATAYARWKGQSLPTENQFHRAAFGSPTGPEQPASSGNFDFKSWIPEPVGASDAYASAFGIYDLVGNGWEWTSTPFAPFDGFKPFPFYAGYSADFFDGKHFVLKGASPRTARSLVRKSFRNWFQPQYPNIYATFRCVQ
jgi:ergothioneine biosynthesis protein EgtB